PGWRGRWSGWSRSTRSRNGPSASLARSSGPHFGSGAVVVDDVVKPPSVGRERPRRSGVRARCRVVLDGYALIATRLVRVGGSRVAAEELDARLRHEAGRRG